MCPIQQHINIGKTSAGHQGRMHQLKTTEKPQQKQPRSKQNQPEPRQPDNSIGSSIEGRNAKRTPTGTLRCPYQICAVYKDSQKRTHQSKTRTPPPPSHQNWFFPRTGLTRTIKCTSRNGKAPPPKKHLSCA